MERFGLSEQTIRKIRTIFSGFPAIRQVLVFGSRAMGTHREGSDIDICLKGEDLTISVLFELNRLLDDLMLPYHFDIVIYDLIDNPDLKDHIDRVGKELLDCNP